MLPKKEKKKLEKRQKSVDVGYPLNCRHIYHAEVNNGIVEFSKSTNEKVVCAIGLNSLTTSCPPKLTTQRRITLDDEIPFASEDDDPRKSSSLPSHCGVSRFMRNTENGGNEDGRSSTTAEGNYIPLAQVSHYPSPQPQPQPPQPTIPPSEVATSAQKSMQTAPTVITANARIRSTFFATHRRDELVTQMPFATVRKFFQSNSGLRELPPPDHVIVAANNDAVPIIDDEEAAYDTIQVQIELNRADHGIRSSKVTRKPRAPVPAPTRPPPATPEIQRRASPPPSPPTPPPRRDEREKFSLTLSSVSSESYKPPTQSNASTPSFEGYSEGIMLDFEENIKKLCLETMREEFKKTMKEEIKRTMQDEIKGMTTREDRRSGVRPGLQLQQNANGEVIPTMFMPIFREVVNETKRIMSAPPNQLPAPEDPNSSRRPPNGAEKAPHPPLSRNSTEGSFEDTHL